MSGHGEAQSLPPEFFFTFSDERGENSPKADANRGRGGGAPHAWRRGQTYIPNRTRGGGR